MSYRLSTIFILHLSAQPLLGLVVRRILLFGDVYFYKVDSQPLSNLDSFEGSDLEGSVVFFVRESFSWFIIRTPRRFCCRPLDWRLCWALLFPMFPVCFGNFRNSWKNSLAIEAISKEVLSQPCVIFVSGRRRFLGMTSLLSRRSYSDGRLSSFFKEI